MKTSKNQKWGLVLGVILSIMTIWLLYVWIEIKKPSLSPSFNESIGIWAIPFWIGIFICCAIIWYWAVNGLMRFERAMSKWMEKMEKE